MRIALFFFLYLFGTSYMSSGQNSTSVYDSYVLKGDSSLSKMQYAEAASLYSKAFYSRGDMGMVKDRYKAARCWSFLNIPDSAFFQLNKIAFKGRYAGVYEIKKDTAFRPLYNDKRWLPLLQQIEKNQQELQNSGMPLDGITPLRQ